MQAIVLLSPRPFLSFPFVLLVDEGPLTEVENYVTAMYFQTLDFIKPEPIPSSFVALD